MKERLTGIISVLSNRITAGLESGSSLEDCQQPTIVDTIEQAKREWLSAKAYFETVSDPELIDYSIYVLEAAERKYMYLLKKAREEGVKGGLTF